MKNDKKLLIGLLVFVIGVCSLLLVQNNRLKQKYTVCFSTTELEKTFCETTYSTYIDDIATSVNTKDEFPCDINLISKETLMEIDGIGSVTAGKIITYRDNINGFNNLEQLLDVDGIGNATYKKLKAYVYVSSAETDKIEKIAQTSKISTTTTAGTTTIQTTTAKTTIQQTEPIIMEQVTQYPININTAPQKLLMELPGIGQVKAATIISYREMYGYFNHSDEIMNVKGIGQKTYDKIKNLITTGTSQSDMPSLPEEDEILIISTTQTTHEEVIIEIVEPQEITTSQTETKTYTLVNINTATKEELMTKLSLSSSEAEAIVTHKEKAGYNFTSKDELLIFIGKAKYDSIYNMITL